jgi:hypothetical protein
LVRVNHGRLAFVRTDASLRSMSANWLRGLAGLAAVVALSTFAPNARAEEEYEVEISKGRVVVEARGEWHINLEYPWKLVTGETRLDKSKFKLTEKTAEVEDVPPGVGRLRGAVCSRDSCHTFEREVTVR